MLTKEQKTRLAKEARKLAMECVEGTAPDFGEIQEFSAVNKPCCAIGHVAARSGIFATGSHYPIYDAIRDGGTDRDLRAAWFVVGLSNDRFRDALPWALLAFADALAKSARK